MEKHKSYYAKFAPQIINVLNANGPGYTYDNPTMLKTGKLNQKIIDPAYTALKDFINGKPRLKNMILKLKAKL